MLDLFPIDAERFSKRAAQLEFDEGLSPPEAERRAASEQGFDTLEELLTVVAANWAERLRALRRPRSARHGASTASQRQR